MKNLIYNLLSSLSEKTDLPLNELCKEFTLNMSGLNHITIGGVKSIITYETDKIELDVCRSNLCVYGRNLELKSYHKTELSIKGGITRIELGKGECI